MAQLEAAGYVKVRKGYVDKRPPHLAVAHRAGRKAFARHRAAKTEPADPRSAEREGVVSREVWRYIVLAVLLVARLAHIAFRYHAIRASGRAVRWEVPAVRWWRKVRGRGNSSSKADPGE